MRRTLQIAALACAALLGGCWVSEKPLITSANSSMPLPAGDFTYHTEGEDLPLSLSKYPGGGYLYSLGDETVPVLAHRIGDGWYVLQSGVAGEPLLYGVGHHKQGRFDIFDPECTEEIAKIDGVEDRDGDCSFATIEALAAASRIVRRQIEAGTEVRLTGWVERQTAVSSAIQAPGFVEAACGGCHAVQPPYLSPNAMAPAFVEVANREGMSADVLLHWLRDAHNYPEEMDFDLDEDQARELSAYIASLREEE